MVRLPVNQNAQKLKLPCTKHDSQALSKPNDHFIEAQNCKEPEPLVLQMDFVVAPENFKPMVKKNFSHKIVLFSEISPFNGNSFVCFFHKLNLKVEMSVSRQLICEK